jgi:threonine synthase
VYFKLENLNPTGSFKDRGTSLLVSLLASRGVTTVVEDSSGNAGASLAAYCGRAGMTARIFCPLSTSTAKLRQIEVYGAELVRVPGPRSAASKAARDAARDGVVYASHVHNPIGLAGMATVAFEIWEQLRDAPDAIVLPVGQGTLLIGLHRGFACLWRTGLIQSVPRLIGVQADRCAPFSALSGRPSAGTLATTSLISVSPTTTDDCQHVDAAVTTLAEGICIADPVRTREVSTAIAESGGTILTASEASIIEGVNALARQGLYVEHTSAVVWPALRQLLVETRLGSVVVMLTGNGLKMAAPGAVPMQL